MEEQPAQTQVEHQIEQDKIQHRLAFEKLLDEDQKTDENCHSKSYMIDNEKARKITQYLNNDFAPLEKPVPTFKFYVTSKQFNLQEEVLSRIVKVKEHQLNLPVATKENAFEILWQIHSVQRGHCGVDKTEDLVKHRYYGLPRKIVSFFVRTCPTCQLKMVQHSQPRLKPIRSDGFMSRMQIDLVDMRHNECLSRGKRYK